MFLTFYFKKELPRQLAKNANFGAKSSYALSIKLVVTKI